MVMDESKNDLVYFFKISECLIGVFPIPAPLHKWRYTCDTVALARLGDGVVS